MTSEQVDAYIALQPAPGHWYHCGLVKPAVTDVRLIEMAERMADYWGPDDGAGVFGVRVVRPAPATIADVCAAVGATIDEIMAYGPVWSYGDTCELPMFWRGEFGSPFRRAALWRGMDRPADLPPALQAADNAKWSKIGPALAAYHIETEGELFGMAP